MFSDQHPAPLAFESLRGAFPVEHRRWVLTASLIGAVGYAFVVIIATTVEHRSVVSECLGLVSCLLGVVLVLAGRASTAGMLVVVALTAEFLHGYLVGFDGIRSSTSFAVPVLVVASGLLLGRSMALLLGSVFSVLGPLAVTLGGELGLHPRVGAVDVGDMGVFFVAMNGTALLTYQFLGVFGELMERQKLQGQRYAELQARLHEAQKLEAVGRLAGGVAHDFNNLLTAVGSHAEVLRAVSSAETREIAEELAAIRARGAALTGQLLTFARREVVQPRPIDAAAVIRGMELLLRRLLGETTTLTLDCSTPAPIVADPGHIEQVAMNLVVNARDAMPRGGAVSVACRTLADSVELTVSDTGEGMDDATRERAFEPFFTTKPQGQGTGLGLSTVHGIVTQYGGSVEIVSAVGRGTTLTLRLPRGPDDLVPHEAPVSVRPEVSGGHVLLVEDDALARRAVRRLLAGAGYQVAEARDATEALALAESARPELLLTDIVMPGLSGIELAALWRERYPEVPVLFISGYSEDVLDSALGPDELLRKPFTTAQLVTKIEAKLKGSASLPPLPA